MENRIYKKIKSICKIKVDYFNVKEFFLFSWFPKNLSANLYETSYITNIWLTQHEVKHFSELTSKRNECFKSKHYYST